MAEMNLLMKTSLGNWNCLLMKGNSSKSSSSSSTTTTKLGNQKLQQSFSPLKISNQNNKESQSLEQSLKSAVFLRREALGIGFSLSFINIFLQPHFTAAAAAEAEATSCDFTLTPSGLSYCDRTLGTGPAAVKGQLIKAHYIGKLENGKVFDSSYERGKPITFRIGAGEVIKGWDQGILGGDGVPPMMSGGKRSLKIPPELAYGIRGAGCRGGTCIIPPNSVLLFDVEFVGKA